MMAAKTAVKPWAKSWQQAKAKFDPKAYIPAVAGYYTAPNGQMLSFPFNSSTTIFYYNKDKFKAAGLDPEKPPCHLARSGRCSCQAQGQWRSALHHELDQLDAARELLDLAQHPVCHQNNGFGGTDSRLAFNSPLHLRHFENLANMSKQGLFIYKGRANAADVSFPSGECAMITGSSGPVCPRQQGNQVCLRHQPAALLPRRRGSTPEHHHRRRQPVGDVGKKPVEYRGVADFAFLSQPEVQSASHKRTAISPSPWPAFEITGEVGLLQAETRYRCGGDADDPQDHRQVARHPPGQLQPDPHHHRRGNRADLGRQEEAKEALDTAVQRGNEQFERFQKANKS